MSPVHDMGPLQHSPRRTGEGSRTCSAHDQRGFSLMEVIIATVIAVIAVLGLAHSFANGRSLIDRYATARDALGVAERRLETLAMLPLDAPDLGIGGHPATPNAVILNGHVTGAESWVVDWVDDPVDDGAADPVPIDYRRVKVLVEWTQGSATDSVVLARDFLAP